MSHLQSALRTIRIEQNALAALQQQLDGAFDAAVETMLSASGQVVVSGMGKSGLIGQKIAATLTSTGTRAFYLHPGDALHGDLGMVSSQDVAVLISYRGETEELLRLLAFLQQNGNPTISITGNPDSTLARNTQHHLNVHVPEEACPLQLAPTASTTATLVLGDALAVALMEARGFDADDFARFHPGGSIGYKLLTRVGDAMRTDNLPIVSADISPADLLMKMSEGKLGMAIIGTPDALQGVVTDGDLRRAMVRIGGLEKVPVSEIMSRNPVTVDIETKLDTVEQQMKERKITTILVTEGGRLAGVYQIFS